MPSPETPTPSNGPASHAIPRRAQVEHTRTERNVLGYIKHPFIVGLNMAFQTKDKLFFVLDYCAGGELFFHLGALGVCRVVLLLLETPARGVTRH